MRIIVNRKVINPKIMPENNPQGYHPKQESTKWPAKIGPAIETAISAPKPINSAYFFGSRLLNTVLQVRI
jgi:hypothetical protein